MPQAIDNNVIVYWKIIPKNIDLLQSIGYAILNKMWTFDIFEIDANVFSLLGM